MKKRFSEEQIVGILREAEAGVAIKEPCRKHGLPEASYYAWRSKYGDMDVSDVKRLRSLEAENARRLKALEAETPTIPGIFPSEGVGGRRISRTPGPGRHRHPARP